MEDNRSGDAERHPEWLDLGGARQRVARLAWATPSLLLPGSDGAAYLKLESLQRSGSFKLRGAANRLMTLSSEERDRGVVTCSSGNHGRAVAEAGSALGVSVTVCVPEWVDPVKAEGIERAGAELVWAGTTYDEADHEARKIAETEGMSLVHPFDDLRVIEGQATVGMEVLDQVPDVAQVLVPLSGGGLVAGVGLALQGTGVRLVAVSAERAAVMHASVARGKPVELPEEPTLASALAGGIGLENRHTFRLVRELVDEFIVVSEEQIRLAMGRAFRDLKLVVEGGGAVALAALWSGAAREGTTVAVVSGGNVELSSLKDLV